MTVPLPIVDPDGRWVEYELADGTTLRMPVVVPQPCPPRLRAPDTVCIRCPRCGKIHAHGDEEGSRLSHCDAPVVPSEYYVRLPESAGPFLPRGWFVKTDGPWRGDAGAGTYADVPGFCKAAKLDEIQKHGHVLTPGRYVGAEAAEDDGEPFDEKMKRLTATLREQQAEAARLDAAIAENVLHLGFPIGGSR
jgi:hypothetical protein